MHVGLGCWFSVVWMSEIRRLRLLDAGMAFSSFPYEVGVQRCLGGFELSWMKTAGFVVSMDVAVGSGESAQAGGRGRVGSGIWSVWRCERLPRKSCYLFAYSETCSELCCQQNSQTAEQLHVWAVSVKSKNGPVSPSRSKRPGEQNFGKPHD